MRVRQGRGRVAVVGGSIAGLFAALLLRGRGWDVMVFERATEALSGRGAGIVTHPQLDRALELAGAAPAEGVEVWRRLVLGADGAVVASHALRQRMTSWDQLWRRLREALPDECYRRGVEFTGFGQHADGIDVRLADGTVWPADVMVGADGLRSAVRTVLVGDREPLYAGYVAWRGLVPEGALSAAAREVLFSAMAFCLPPGEQMVGYPVGGPNDDLRPGHRRFNWVWYRPADPAAALPALLTDRNGQRHAVSIPPPLVRDEAVSAMREAAAALLAPAFQEVVEATERPFLQPIYDLESPLLAEGRVALIGDAAFVARPHVGAGTTKAAEDALALADALDRAEPVAALAEYARLRRPEGQRLLRRARHLGAYMQAEQGSEEERSAAERHRTANAVLGETAILTF